MAGSRFDPETLVGFSVTSIPTVIIAVFLLGSFPAVPFAVAISLALHVVPFVALGILTYSGLTVSDPAARPTSVPSGSFTFTPDG
ncbi:DUF6684 family protein [Halorussus marinus]|uniref:DUF6684 family protein n=1 Tax=Halorussus marinus TaxID=2505976 RepID=UPI00106E2D19|nr:DUF6684 family protein [Halorussus marinus]